jgi:hypothetical protein
LKWDYRNEDAVQFIIKLVAELMPDPEWQQAAIHEMRSDAALSPE